MVVTEGTIHRLALDGSATSVLATGLMQPSSLAIAGDQLYFRSSGSACSLGSNSSAECLAAGVQPLPLAGGEVEALSTHDVSGDFVVSNIDTRSTARAATAPLGAWSTRCTAL